MVFKMVFFRGRGAFLGLGHFAWVFIREKAKTTF